MARLVFMGSDAIAVPLLEELVRGDGAELVAVVTGPDRRTGRGLRTQPNAIKAWAVERGLEVRQPQKPGEEEVTWLQARGIDLVLVMAYGHLLKKRMRGAVPLGLVNFHASLLPKLRGASPVEAAIASGERETGVSLMRIVRRMDAGPVMDRECVGIDDSDTGPVLREKLARACVPLWRRCREELLAGRGVFTEQDEAAATYCRIMTKEDGTLDFRAPAWELERRVRALVAWPGCAFEHGGVRIKVLAAEVLPDNGAASAGTVIESGGELRIQTGEGIFAPRQLQRPGGKVLAVREFLRGYSIESGTELPLLEMAPLVAANKL